MKARWSPILGVVAMGILYALSSNFGRSIYLTGAGVSGEAGNSESSSAEASLPEGQAGGMRLTQAAISQPVLSVASVRQPRKSLSTRIQRPIDSWNLENTGVDADEISAFLEKGQPESIIVFGSEGISRIYPDQYTNAADLTDRTLFVGTAESVRKTVRDRQERAERRVTADSDSGADGDKRMSPLAENAYEIVTFHPGRRDNGEILRPIASDILAAIQGPDYSLENSNPQDDNQTRELLSKVLSFGHGGELLLKAAKNGLILDKPGFDFTVFENAFRVAGTGNVFQEFGYVGISESDRPESFRWFPCDPRKGVLRGCVGAVPTDEGGDQFDLAELGLERVRYIWIKDIGINKNYPSKWPTEGIDLDAVRLEHAYSQN